MQPEAQLATMLRERVTFDMSGKQRQVTGGISEREAEFIMSLVQKEKLCKCVETGVALGVSTLAICTVLSHLQAEGASCKLYGVDPCQHSEHGGAAIETLRRCGLDSLFELLEGPSHEVLPSLLGKVSADLVFVDGWHTFDYTLVDVFLADKLLRPGGYLLMHDYAMPSKKKVWAYLRTHRKYRRLPGPHRPLSRRILSAGKQALLLNLRRSFSIITASSNMVVAQKTVSFEPPHDFYRTF